MECLLFTQTDYFITVCRSDHRIIESLRLEKISKIIKTNCQATHLQMHTSEELEGMRKLCYKISPSASFTGTVMSFFHSLFFGLFLKKKALRI